MKKRLFLLSLFLFSQIVFAKEFPWELKKNEAGIEVHVRKVEGSPILEYKGRMTVDASLEQVIAFYDENRMTEWFHQCVESRFLEDRGPDEKVLYFVIDLPWPVKDRDLGYRRLRSVDPATGVVEYHISALPDIYPKQQGRIRMPSLKGIWRFTPLEGGKTEIYYQQHSDVGGHIPAVLVNRLAVDIPFNSLSNFRRLLTQ
ncbi:MAG: START domain-containing protein [Candidatus Omnitrophica bacterium]|nr:START domain-containing protein [Candidatus Omnitrophota bacterium]